MSEVFSLGVVAVENSRLLCAGGDSSPEGNDEQVSQHPSHRHKSVSIVHPNHLSRPLFTDLCVLHERLFPLQETNKQLRS
jgi:hypothetical protein